MANWKCCELRDYWSLIPGYLETDVINFMGVCREFCSYGETHIYSRNFNMDHAYEIREYIDLHRYIVAILKTDNVGDADIREILSIFDIDACITNKRAISAELWEHILTDLELFNLFFNYDYGGMILVPYSAQIPFQKYLPKQVIFWIDEDGYLTSAINMILTESQLFDNIGLIGHFLIDVAVMDIIQNNPCIILRFPCEYIENIRHLCIRIFRRLGYNPIIGIHLPIHNMQKYAPLAYCLHYHGARQIGWAYHADYEIFNNRL